MSTKPRRQAHVHLDLAYEVLMNSMRDAVFMLDELDRVIRVNPSARLMLGLPESEILDHPFIALFPEVPSLSDLYENGKSLRVVLRRSGWSSYYDLQVTSLREQSRSTSQEHFVIFHDVTGLEMAEEELRKWARTSIKLDNLGRVTGGLNRIQVMLRSLTVHVCELLNADGAAIVVWDEEIHAIRTFSTDGVLYPWSDQSKDDILPLVTALIELNDIVVIENNSVTGSFDQKVAHILPGCASIIFPLRTSDTPLGVILAGFREPHHFLKEDISRFERAMGQIRLPIIQACFLGKLESTVNENLLETEKANRGLLNEISDRTNSEKKLQEEYDFITGILDTLDALVIVIDRKGSIVRVNRACEVFFGYSSQEFTRKRVWDLLLQSQDNVTIKDMFDNIQAGLSPFQYANHWQTKDGVQKMMAWSSSMINDPFGNIEFIVAIGMDITEKKHIEKLLERERLLFRGLINSIPDFIFYKNRSGVYLGWNTAFAAFRLPKPIKNDVTDAELYPPDLAKRFMETDYQVIETGKAITYENWTTNAAGQQLLIETRKTPYFDSDGGIVGVIGIGRDITRHRNAENALRTANLEIEQLIDSISSFLIVVTRDLYVSRWNARAQSLFGLQTEQVIGMHLTALGISWEKEPIFAGIKQCDREYKPSYLDPIYFKRLNGSEGYLGMNISPIFGSEHTLSGYILLGSDITDRITMERQVTQTQKLESIGRLAAGIAHEINTPMQYIGDNTSFLQQSFAQLISALNGYQEILTAAENGSIQPQLIQEVKAIIQSIELDYLLAEVPVAITQTLDGIQHVVEIISAMKGFSHPGVKVKTPVNINKALLDTLTVSRNVWKYVATAETDFDSDLPNIACLPGEMNQVYLNIIVNAADAIADIVGDGSLGKGKITIRTRQDQDWVEIRISDTGTGIPEEIRSRIFEPFYTTKKVGKGSGQGLAIAYDIVEVKHGGTLTCVTKIGEGTSFIIRLPILSGGE